MLLQLATALSLTIASIIAIAAVRAVAGEIEVREAFSRASIGQATAGVVYLQLVNHASQPDRLLTVSTPVAERTDLHMTERDGDIVRMRRLETLLIPPRETLAFSPGGAHIMLSGLKAPLREGDRIDLILQFERAGEVALEVPVRSVTAGADAAEDGNGHAAH
ncbi:MAG TPA: copper chaperone PCu(A)C [Sphingomicrobium sp.]